MRKTLILASACTLLTVSMLAMADVAPSPRRKPKPPTTAPVTQPAVPICCPAVPAAE